MDKLIEIVNNPLLWTVIVFIAGAVIKAKLNSYLKLLNLLITAVEVYDNEIQDIIDDKTREKLMSIKERISGRLKTADQKKEKLLLNNLLDKRGLRHGKTTDR